MSGELSRGHSNLPEKKFKAGQLVATVWRNEARDAEGNLVTYRTVTFEKRYMDKDNHWRTTNALKVTDLPKAVLVLSKAYEYLALSESEEDSEKTRFDN